MLRAALDEVNAGRSITSITLPAGTYTLVTTLGGSDNINAGGDLDLLATARPVTIEGSGVDPGGARIDADAAPDHAHPDRRRRDLRRAVRLHPPAAAHHRGRLHRSRRLAGQLRFASIPTPATLDDFDHDAQPGVDPALLAELATCRCRYLETATNVLLIGPPGVGKTPL